MKKHIQTLLGCGLFLLPLSTAAQAAYAIIDLTLLEAPNDSAYAVGDVHRAFVTYDTSSLIGLGSETIASDDILSLSFEFNETTYDKSHDIASGYPKLHFYNRELVGIDYWNTLGLTNGGESSFFTFYPDRTFTYSPYGESEYTGQYEINSVPEIHPSIYFLSSLGWILLRRHRPV